MKIRDLTEARMGTKDLMTVSTDGFTFGFEFEVVVDNNVIAEKFPEITGVNYDKIKKDFEEDVPLTISQWWTNQNTNSQQTMFLMDLTPNFGRPPIEDVFTDQTEILLYNLFHLPETSNGDKLQKLRAIQTFIEDHTDDFYIDIEDLRLIDDNQAKKLLKDNPTAFNNILEDAKNFLKPSIAFMDEALKKIAYIDERQKTFKYVYQLSFDQVEKIYGRDNLTHVLEKYEEYKANRLNSYVSGQLKDILKLEKLAKKYLKNRLEGTGVIPKRFTRKYNTWAIVNDWSIDTNNGQHGFEIVSPVFKDYETAMENLKSFLEFISNDPAISTNDTTGLHMNVGRSNWQGNEYKENLDLLKLILFVNENYVKGEFNRLHNEYSLSILKTLNFVKSKTPISDSSTMNTFIKEMNKRIISSAEHYKFIDLKKLSRGYLEIRTSGSNGYEKDLTKIKEHLHRYILAINIASNKDLYKEQYYKKIYRMLNNIIQAKYPEQRVTGNGVQSTVKKELISIMERIHKEHNIPDLALYMKNIREEVVSLKNFWLFVFEIQRTFCFKTKKDIVIFTSNDLINLKNLYISMVNEVRDFNQAEALSKYIQEKLVADSYKSMSILFNKVKPAIMYEGKSK